MSVKINVLSGGEGGKAQSVELKESVFGVDYNPALVHQVVTAYQLAGRQGTRAQKTRAEVRGGGRKPYAQKGTGQARAGTIRSPLWRKGGRIFAAKPQDFSQKVNKKMQREAMRSIYSELLREGRLVAVDGLEIAAPKTKSLTQKLAQLQAPNALIIIKEENKNLTLSARNLINVGVCDAGRVDPASLIRHEKVVMTLAALKHVEAMLA